ncbi:MAG: hypothetical protein SNJ59_09585 [Aggregatilineales bacterium]
MTARNAVPTITTGLLGDFRLLLTLFIAFRMMMALVYQPLLVNGVERGVSAGGDFLYYYQLGALSEEGYLPFRDWWSEFPPVPSLLNTVIYQLVGRDENYPAFALMFGLLMLICEIGNLFLVRRIGTRLHGAITGMGLAWVYGLLLAPLVFMWWNFEPLVAFFLLLGVSLLIDGRPYRAGAAAGAGALVKFTPALILGAVWRFLPRRAAVRSSALALSIFGGVYLLLFLQNTEMTLPSLTAQFNKPSYQTVWALIDGSYRTGNFGPPEDRLDPATAAIGGGPPAVVPGIVRLTVAVAIGAFVFMRTRRHDERGLVAFVAITLLIFFLQAQGWSPQWLSQILPLLLLCFPTRQSITTLILLTLLTFAEYPFLFIRTGDTGGVIEGALMTPFIALVLSRTLLLLAYCAALYRQLCCEPVKWVEFAR